VRIVDGVRFKGDASEAAAYYSYGQRVLAAADATVAFARDGVPENRPGHGSGFKPAIPITLDSVSGNTVVLDLGGGQYGYYMHLQPGSVSVRTGDKVRMGQPIGRVGISGDAREPHLHFEVTNSPKVMLGDGVPYVIDRYRTGGKLVRRELPLNQTVVDFPEAAR
jgi:murein DD-endopeptidase MepM/ murein hydrolase activator NlpD